MANVENLQRTLDHITAHPEFHRQTQWGRVEKHGADGTPVRPTVASDQSFQSYPSCGTSGCLAGWANHLHGWTMISQVLGDDPYGAPLFKVVPNIIASRLSELTAPAIEKASEHIQIQAHAILDLTAYEGDALFHGDNQLVHLWALAYALTDGQIKLPEVFPRGKGKHLEDYLIRVDPHETGLDTMSPEGVAGLINAAMQELADGCGADQAMGLVDEYASRNADKIVSSQWLMTVPA